MATQSGLKRTYRLFPDFAAIVPLANLEGSDPAIKSFADIEDPSNSFVINNTSDDFPLVLSEEAVPVTFTRTADEVMGFDEAGRGPEEELTIERSCNFDINVNGWSTFIDAILQGLDPKNDILEDAKFLKAGGDSVLTVKLSDSDDSTGFAVGELITIAHSDLDNYSTNYPSTSPQTELDLQIVVTGVDGGKITDFDVVFNDRGEGYPSDLYSDTVTDVSGGQAGTGADFVVEFRNVVSSAAVNRQSNAIKKKYLVVFRCPEENGGNIYYVFPRTTVRDEEMNLPIQPQKVTTMIPFKSLKVNSPTLLSNIQSIFGAVTSRSELMYPFYENSVRLYGSGQT